MKVVAWDTETFLIAPGNPVPPVCCLSWFDGEQDGLLDHVEGPLWLERQLDDPQMIVVGHNVVFDLAVCVRELPRLLPKVFRAYDEGRIRCTMIREKLIDIAKGTLKFHTEEGRTVKTSHGLAEVVRRRFKRHLPKQDTWRLRYGELYGVPIDEWPQEAIDYALRDSWETLDVFRDQQGDFELEDGEEWPGSIPDEVPKTRSAWALHLMSCWGLRADPEAVEKLAKEAIEIRDEAYEVLLRTGLARWGGTKKVPKVVKDMKAIRQMVVELYEGIEQEAPKTEPSARFPEGQVSTDRDALSLFAQRHDDDKRPVEGFWDERAEALLEIAGPILSTWVPALREATRRPLNPQYNVPQETGRTSCSKGSESNPGAQVQNPPRKGGVRECFIPRPGKVFAFCDYATIELCTWAQACLDLVGFSNLAVAINGGEDPHASYAAFMMGVSYDEFMKRLKDGDSETKDARQNAKCANFGYPGGLGPKTYVSYARGYGLKLTFEQAVESRNMFRKRYPEALPYFEFIGRQTEAHVPIVQLRSKRVRSGDTRFTARANGYFQALATDGAQAAMWDVAKECYVDETSPLFGSRPVLFLHDELGLEVPEERGHECAMRLQEIMIRCMQPFVPDVRVQAQPVLMRRWFKGAEPVYVDGRLVPSRPVKEGKKTKWVPDQNFAAAA